MSARNKYDKESQYWGLLTPDLANELLLNNKSNRRLSMSDVRKYASDITRGQWDRNAEPVQIAVGGGLLNGQHRCHAVIKTGIAIEVLFVVVDERGKRLRYDTNRVRSLHDEIALETGWKNSVSVAATIRSLYDIETMSLFSGRNNRSKYLTKKDGMNLLNRYVGIDSAVECAAYLLNRGCGTFTKTAIATYLYVYSTKYEPPVVLDLARKLCIGVGVEEQTAPHAAIRKMNTFRNQMRGKASAGVEFQAEIVLWAAMKTFFGGSPKYQENYDRTRLYPKWFRSEMPLDDGKQYGIALSLDDVEMDCEPAKAHHRAPNEMQIWAPS